MKNLKMAQLQEYAEQKTIDYLIRNFCDDSYNEQITADILRKEFESEFNACMDLFISGYRFAEGLNDFETEFEFTLID